MMGEEWRPVVGFEGVYEISNTGKLKSLPKQKGSVFAKEHLMHPRLDKNGYLVTTLSNKGIHKTAKIHRLVAEAFIPRIDGKTQVNHIDGNKENNNVDNLEWCDCIENIRHAIDTGLRDKHYQSIPCILTNKATGEVRRFDSMKDGSIFLGHTRGYLIRKKRIYGNTFEHGGYIIQCLTAS